MAIGLGKEIPDAIYRYIDSFAADMMSDTEAQQLQFAQCVWALHPGSAERQEQGGEWLGCGVTLSASLLQPNQADSCFLLGCRLLFFLLCPVPATLPPVAR